MLVTFPSPGGLRRRLSTRKNKPTFVHGSAVVVGLLHPRFDSNSNAANVSNARATIDKTLAVRANASTGKTQNALVEKRCATVQNETEAGKQAGSATRGSPKH
jgi:hypothetical protein